MELAVPEIQLRHGGGVRTGALTQAPSQEVDQGRYNTVAEAALRIGSR